MRIARSIVLALLLSGVVAPGLVACGSSNEDSGATSGSAALGGGSAQLIAVPESVKSRGYLSVAASRDYPPYTYAAPNGEMVGLEVELVNAITAKLGLEPRFNELTVEAAIPSVANGRNDVMIMAMFDTPERRKVVDFINVYKTALYVMTRKGNPSGLSSDDLCGRKLAVTSGTVMVGVAARLAQECETAGKPKLEILETSDNPQEYLAVRQGRVDGDLVDPAFGAYYMEQQEDFELLPGAIPLGDVKHSGWILAKGNTELQEAMLDAMNALIEDGTWEKIMSEYGVGELALVPPLLNGKPAPENWAR